MGGACGKGAVVHDPQRLASNASRRSSFGKPTAAELQMHAQLMESERQKAFLQADLLRHKLQGIERENNRLIEALAKSSEMVRSARMDVAESRTWRNATAASFSLSTPAPHNTPTHHDRFALVTPFTPERTLSMVESDDGQNEVEEGSSAAPETAVEAVAGGSEGRELQAENDDGIEEKKEKEEEKKEGGGGSQVDGLDIRVEAEKEGEGSSLVREEEGSVEMRNSEGDVRGDDCAGVVGNSGGWRHFSTDDCAGVVGNSGGCDGEGGIKKREEGSEDERGGGRGGGGGVESEEEWDKEEERKAAEEQEAMRLAMGLPAQPEKASIIKPFNGDAAGGGREGEAGAERVIDTGEDVGAGVIGEDHGGGKDGKAEIARQRMELERERAVLRAEVEAERQAMERQRQAMEEERKRMEEEREEGRRKMERELEAAKLIAEEEGRRMVEEERLAAMAQVEKRRALQQQEQEQEQEQEQQQDQLLLSSGATEQRLDGDGDDNELIGDKHIKAVPTYTSKFAAAGIDGGDIDVACADGEGGGGGENNEEEEEEAGAEVNGDENGGSKAVELTNGDLRRGEGKGRRGRRLSVESENRAEVIFMNMAGAGERPLDEALTLEVDAIKMWLVKSGFGLGKINQILEQLDQLLAEADSNRDGLIQWQEFVGGVFPALEEAEEDIKKGLQVRLIKRSMSGVDAPLVNTSDAVIVIETPDESAAAALGTPPNHGVVHGTPDSAAADWLPLTTGTPDSAAADWLPLTTAEVRSVVSGVVGVMIEGIATSMAEISSSSLDFPTQKDDGGERASCTEGGAFEGAQGDMVLEQASNGVEEGGGYREAVVQVVAGIVSAAGDNAASLLSHSVLHAGGDDCKELSRDRSGGAVMGLPASRKTRAKNMAGHDGELGASVVSPEGAGDAGGGDAKGSKGVRGADEDVGIERAPSWVVNHSVPDPGGKAQDAESKGSMNGPGVEDSCVRRIPSIPTGEQGEVALFPVHGSDKFAGNGGMRDGEKCAASDDRRLAEAAAKMDSAKGIMTTAGRGASGGASQGAVLLLEEALAIREEVLGAKHPATCNTKNALGNAYDQEGAHEKALECYEGALEGLQGGGGYGNLGGALRSLGRFDQALGAYEKAVLIDKQTLGPDHIDVAKGEYGLAMTLDRMGRHEQALDMYTDVLRIQGIEYHVEVKGNFDRGRAEGAAEVGREGALAVASTLNNAGLVLERMGRYQEALERLEEAQALRVAALGKAHLDVSATLFNIAIVKRGKGDSKGAFDACEESLSVCRGALGDVHERTRRRLELIKHLESEREQPGGPKSPM